MRISLKCQHYLISLQFITPVTALAPPMPLATRDILPSGLLSPAAPSVIGYFDLKDFATLPFDRLLAATNPELIMTGYVPDVVPAVLYSTPL